MHTHAKKKSRFDFFGRMISGIQERWRRAVYIFLDRGKQTRDKQQRTLPSGSHICIGGRITFVRSKHNHSTPLGLRLQDLLGIHRSNFHTRRNERSHGQLRKKVRLRSENNDKRKLETTSKSATEHRGLTHSTYFSKQTKNDNRSKSSSTWMRSSRLPTPPSVRSSSQLSSSRT